MGVHVELTGTLGIDNGDKQGEEGGRFEVGEEVMRINSVRFLVFRIFFLSFWGVLAGYGG